MKNNNYRILLLSDLKKPTESTLKSTVSLAKMIGGQIDFFHVKKPTDVVVGENQLSAIRNIKEEQHLIRKNIQQLITPISEEFGMPISYNFTIGNVKNEIADYIKETKPDIVVLGKRKPKRLKFIGDSITHFILTNFEGVVFIAAENNAIEPNKKVTIGLFNDVTHSFNIDFAAALLANTETTLKSFNILSKNDTGLNKTTSSIPTEAYTFEQGDNAVKNVSKYIAVNNINLLCINRKNGVSLAESNINEAMDTLNVSLLVNREKLQLNNSL
ncbi:universal stress protein [Aequorivita sp. Q41]|uniref:universal stress protein n=1 Tax=Aequorivita sp. Q41 TaxID=3153300 RepID=UPI003241E147